MLRYRHKIQHFVLNVIEDYVILDYTLLVIHVIMNYEKLQK